MTSSKQVLAPEKPRSGPRRLVELSHQIHHGMVTYRESRPGGARSTATRWPPTRLKAEFWSTPAGTVIGQPSATAPAAPSSPLLPQTG
jgi:hypothetical protein